ncbi:MAG: TonB-dependent receptor [Tannerella sp.]|jgi:outer membrane cobalamin receptor|nr:TonB-dependent receptor [Tannerella sp.]
MSYFFFRKELLLGVALSFAVVPAAQERDTLVLRSLSDVEVFGKAPPAAMRAGAPVQTLDRTHIERLGMQDLSEAVGRFSGVTVQDYGGIGGLKTVSVRSLGAQHTAVNYDGITVTDAQRGQVDLSCFSLDNVESVTLSIGQSDEIFQTARMYASAGALNIRTSEPVFADRSRRLHAKIRGGSFGMFNPSARYEQKLGRFFALSTHAEWLSAKGDYPFTLTNGQIVTKETRRNSDIQSLRTEANLYGRFAKGGALQAKVYYYDSERGLPGSVVLYTRRNKERLWDRNFFTQMHYRAPLSRTLTWQALAKYNYTYSRYHNADEQYAEGFATDRNTQREYYASAGLRFAPASPWSVSLSGDVSHTALVSNVVGRLSPERLTSLTALAAQYGNTRLTVTASLLATLMRDDVKQGSRPGDKRRLSPAVSLSFRPLADHAVRLRLSCKDAFRVPTFADLYYVRMGNTNLRPEKATQWNAGLTWNGRIPAVARYVTLSADGYYNRVTDKIVALPTMYVFKMMNTGKVAITGADVNASAECPLGTAFMLTLSSSYSYQHAVDVTTSGSQTYGHQIPYTPRHSGTASAACENPWVNAGYMLTLMGERYVLPQNNAANRTGGYAEHTFTLNKTFAFRTCRVRLQAEALNAANRTYDVIRYYPMPGRSFRFTLNIEY